MNWSEVITIKEAVLLGVGGLLGYVSNIIVAKQTAKRKNLIVQTVGRKIIVEAADRCPFDVLDKHGNKLSDVYLICVRLWNKGGEHILGEDISTEYPLLITFSGESNVLGEPMVFRGGSDIGLQITQKTKGVYQVAFECVNSGEWAELGFFVKDNPRVPLSASGRIFGQESDFAFHIDDQRATMGERLLSFFLVAFSVSSPIALIVGLVFLVKDYPISALWLSPDSLPDFIALFLAYGLLVPMLFAQFYFFNWLERKRNPKTYPLERDYMPSEAQNIGAMWGTALSGRRYGVSSSIHSIGQIITTNEGHPSNTSNRQGTAGPRSGPPDRRHP